MASMKDKTMIFKVSYTKDIYRILEVRASSSLYNLADYITRSFDFYFDHCFGFFSRLEGDYMRSEESYELFNDLEDVEPSGNGLGVEKFKVGKVFQPGKKMLFHFDYGDDWQFIVECLSTADRRKELRYPIVRKSVGRAPEQYSAYEEESA